MSSKTTPDPAVRRDAAYAGLPPLKSVIAQYDLGAKKSFGQHFLLDLGVTDRVARTAGNLEGVNVIEVGPGPGGLTRSLLAAGTAKLYVIEKDERFMTALEDIKNCAPQRMEIVRADALKIDATTLAPSPRKIVANLPYNVGTELLIQWLHQIYQNAGSFASLTLMFQKEVADRIVAEPNSKDFGRLTVLAQWLCETRMDFELPPEAFSPPPKVDSAVVTLIPRATPLVDVELSVLEKVMAAAFNQRRKMLRGSLKSLGVDVEAWLARAGVAGDMRPEQLDVITLCKLAKAFTT